MYLFTYLLIYSRAESMPKNVSHSAPESVCMKVVHPYVMAPLSPSYVAQQKVPSGSHLGGNGIAWDNPDRM